LTERRDRAGKAHGDGAVEQPDVDAELECVRGRHSEQLALDQATFDPTSLRRCVAGAVRREAPRRLRIDSLGRELVNELRCPSALGEADRSQPARDEFRHQARCVPERARPQPELGIDELRIPEQNRPLRARRTVVGEDARLDSRECRSKFPRIGDRCGGEQELRLGTVDPREPAQTSEHVRDM
jgi:hypothetical protein